MIAKGREIQDSQDDQRDHPAIDQHAEHQPLMHHCKNLAPLADKAKPLGPGCDESGRRCVHRAVPESLVVFFKLAFTGSGASGSTLAIRTGFVTGLDAASTFLSPAFFAVAAGFASAGFCP